MLFRATRSLAGHETLEDESYVVRKASKFTDSEIFGDFTYNILRVFTIPTYRVNLLCPLPKVVRFKIW